ncbi:MAG: F0F1 ATP synthase subunit A [Gemmatimonadota bacterium]
MDLSPDALVYWQWGMVEINATLVFTWVTMALLVLGSWLVTRGMKSGVRVSKSQAFLEIVVTLIRGQIRDATHDEPDQYLPLVGTLFLFIAVSHFLSIIPGVSSPAASLSTTSALALCVFVAVPAYGIKAKGVTAYLRNYLQPSPFMLPFNVIGELSRTLALAVRLFGNIMSGRLIAAVLLSVVPFIFPAILEAFGLLIGFIQAYVFAVLALVYIASGTRATQEAEDRAENQAGSQAGQP